MSVVQSYPLDYASLARRLLVRSLADRGAYDKQRETEGSADQVVAGSCLASRPMQKRSRSSTGNRRVIVRISLFTATLGLIMCTMSLAAWAPPQTQTHTVTIE